VRECCQPLALGERIGDVGRESLAWRMVVPYPDRVKDEMVPGNGVPQSTTHRQTMEVPCIRRSESAAESRQQRELADCVKQDSCCQSSMSPIFEARIRASRPALQRAVVAGLFGVLAACRGEARPSAGETAEVSVTVSTGAIAAPDAVSPGWRRVHVEETDGAHIVVAFRLPTTTTPEEVSAFVAALDTAAATPRSGVAIGGPEVGARGDVVLQLTPGVYVLACVRRGDDGHRHASRGESTVIHVASATAADTIFAAPPPSSQNVRLVDFAYVGPDRWAPGAQLLRIENTGLQDHQLRVARLRDGATLQMWMQADDPDTVATAIVGMARLGPGQVAYLPVNLTTGTYVAYCLVTDGATKRPHVELGMFRTYQVP
jgi:hypothetical protein